MNWIQGVKFKTKGVEYIITGVWFQGGSKVAYEFKTYSRDEDVKQYYMAAVEFESKVKIEDYVGIG